MEQQPLTPPEQSTTSLHHVAIPGPPAVRLAFADVGPFDAPPIVLIHGVGGMHEQWANQIPALATHFRCLAPSLRGHGASETTPGPYSMERLRDDLLQLVELRGITRPLSLLAHSYGGLLALDFALAYPARIHKLVLLGLAEYMNFGKMFRMIATLPAPNGLLDLARRLLLADRFYARVHVLRAVMREAILPWQGWPILDRIAQPILLLGGQYDVVAPPPAMRALARRFPHARHLTIRGARHKIQIQQPDAVNRQIMDFLDE